MSENLYVCAISGVSAPGTEDTDEEEGIPVGWTAITLATRTENPEWVVMMEARDVVVQQQLLQIPDEEREKSRPLARILARSQFAALEQMTPRYIVEERQVYVSTEQLGALHEFLGQNDE